MKRLLKVIVSALVFASILSFNIESGDLRWNVDDWTVRHWNVVPVTLHFNAGCALPRSGGFPCGSSASTTYSLSGPSTGPLGAATSNFTVQATGIASAVITPHDTSSCGTFTPATVTLANTNPVTFTYTPVKTGSYNITTTNSGTLTNPAAIAFSIGNLDPGYPNFSTGWGNNSTTTTTAITDPCGGTNAVNLTESATNDYHHFAVTSNITITANGSNTFTVLCKEASGTRNIVLVVGEPGGTAAFFAVFNPSTGALITTGSWGTAVAKSTTSLAVGSYFLVQVNGNLNGGFTSAQSNIFMDNGQNGVDTYLGDGTSTISLYGAAFQ